MAKLTVRNGGSQSGRASSAPAALFDGQNKRLQMKQAAENAIKELNLDKGWAHYFTPDENPRLLIFKSEGQRDKRKCVELRNFVLSKLNEAFEANNIPFRAMRGGFADFYVTENMAEIPIVNSLGTRQGTGTIQVGSSITFRRKLLK